MYSRQEKNNVLALNIARINTLWENHENVRKLIKQVLILDYTVY